MKVRMRSGNLEEEENIKGFKLIFQTGGDGPKETKIVEREES